MTNALHDIDHASLTLTFASPEAAADFAIASGGSSRQSADNPLAVECDLVVDGRPDFATITLLTQSLARRLVGQLDQIAQAIGRQSAVGD